MLVLGITGGIASGKSHVLRTFARAGAVTFSADEAARAILIPKGRVLRQIEQAFGAGVLSPDGSLNRAELASQIFPSPTLRHTLDTIMHPPILELLATQIESARYELSPRTIVAVEVPLLYEVGLERWFDCVIVVSSTEAEQIERLCQRSRLTPQEAQTRLSAQMPLEEKRRRADIVLENRNTLSVLEADALRLWNRLQDAFLKREKEKNGEQS